MSKNILLIEDDDALRQLFRQVVDATGNYVTEASTRAEALALLENDDYDLMICDVQLTDGDTLDIVEVCCEHNMDVVVITSNEAHKTVCIDMGVLAFVLKPIPPRDLMTIVTDVGSLDIPGSYVDPRARH